MLAGCGSSDTGASTSSGPDPATGAPISVGFVNSDSGSIALPEVTAMAKAAADWINGHGGVDGRPLKLETCSTDGTPATSTSCANDLVGKNVLAVLNGDDGSLDSALPIFKKAGLHIFGAMAGPAVQSDPDNTIMLAPSAAATAATGPVQKLMGIHNGVFVLPNIGPEMKTAFDGIKAASASADVRLTLSLVAPANPDITAAVNAAKSQHADGIILALSENDCTNAVRTARSMNWTGELVVGQCTQFIKDLGPQAAGVKTVQNLFPYGSRASAEKYDGSLKQDFDTYEAAAKAAGAQKYLDFGYAPYGYSTVMTFVDLLKGLGGDITRTTVNRAMASFKGRQVLGTPQDCTAKLMPGGACGRDLIALETQADGSQTLVGGKPLDLGTIAGGK
ncbi:hypothetical protein BGM09_07270 [Streptomyces sp. CBMA29]|nr:hypothetical protein [Streptomyces sp. CBMA29]